jgi:DNA-binding transcriptional ArsR family regulator
VTVSAKSEVLLHPVRLRIVLAMGGETLTTTQLAARLPDVAHATLYRQVAILAEAGLLEVVDERRVRGGTERTYSLVSEAVRMGPDEAAAMGTDEHMRGFVTFVGSLVEAFGRYIGSPDADPAGDAVGYRQAALWLDTDQQRALVERLVAAVSPYLGQEPTPERQRILLNTILIPDLHARSPEEDTKDRRDPS